MAIKNKCILIGRTGADMEIKRFDDGNCVGNVSLAIDESYTDKNGQKVEQTTWANLVAFNKTAEVFSKYVLKGNKICVEAAYRVRKWEDKNGENRYAHEFVIQGMEFMESKKNETNNTSPSAPGREQSVTDQYQNQAGSGAKDDDLPF